MNERQYRITKVLAQKFECVVEQSRDLKGTSVDLLLQKIHEDAVRSQLASLHAELEEYEGIRSGQWSMPAIEFFEQIPHTLIKGRIAAGLTQEGLAKRLGLKHQQVQRYEATQYRSASLTRILEVARALSEEVALGLVDAPDNNVDDDNALIAGNEDAVMDGL